MFTSLYITFYFTLYIEIIIYIITKYGKIVEKSIDIRLWKGYN